MSNSNISKCSELSFVDKGVMKISMKTWFHLECSNTIFLFLYVNNLKVLTQLKKKVPANHINLKNSNYECRPTESSTGDALWREENHLLYVVQKDLSI